MTLLTSAPQGYAVIRLGGLLRALLLIWLMPAAIGALALAVQWLLNTPALGGAGLMAWATTVLLVLSPLLSWLALVLAAPFVAALLDRGWFGWIPALLLGMASGGVLAYLLANDLAITFGAALITALRALLAKRHPSAF